MNRIVRESYAVADLPEDLRQELADIERVRIVFEPICDATVRTRPSLGELRALGHPTILSFDEIVSHVDALRADWD